MKNQSYFEYFKVHNKYNKNYDPMLLIDKIKKLEDTNYELIKSNSIKDQSYQKMIDKYDDSMQQLNTLYKDNNYFKNYTSKLKYDYCNTLLK